ENGENAERQSLRNVITAEGRAASGSTGVDVVDALKPATHLKPRSFSYIDQSVVDRLERRLRTQTRASLMQTWGISANTWAKLKAGEPVRTSLAERLIERIIARETGARDIRQDG